MSVFKGIVASEEISNYFTLLNNNLKEAYKLAKIARAKGYDPSDNVEIPLAENMAERVEGLISAVIPQLKGKGIIKRIHELEDSYGALAWEVAFRIAEEVADQKFCKFSSLKEALEAGIRTGFAYHTVGIVSAPLEGFVELKFKKRRDKGEYIAVKYAGPIRGAGGTAAAFSVMLTDYLRQHFNIPAYDPSDDELNRFYTELQDYHERVTNLQYNPSKKEVMFLVKNIPVEIDGDPTENIEVSNYKDLSRVETNRIRSGLCLVLSMVALKAPKLLKKSSHLRDINFRWSFLEEFVKIQKKVKAKGKTSSDDRVTPNTTFIADLVAGRPVLSYPMRKGGFRLRYGRTRMSGLSSAAIHPATMVVLDDFVATATQLKVERPGKAAAITPCDYIEGPIVKLRNGSVIRVESENEARRIKTEIAEILFLGDILFNYGDFSENNHPLVPPGYCEEWWVKELEKSAVSLIGTLDFSRMSDLSNVPADTIRELINNPLKAGISAEHAFSLSSSFSIPLHPKYTYHWLEIGKEDVLELIEWMAGAKFLEEEGLLRRIILPFSNDERDVKRKRMIEVIGLPHSLVKDENIVLSSDDAFAFSRTLSVKQPHSATTAVEKAKRFIEENPDKDTLSLLSALSGIPLRDKSGIFIGARMGRPEKAKERELTGSPNVLFPIGEEGGRLRSFQAAMEKGQVKGDFAVYYCKHCDARVVYPVCPFCGRRTERLYFCPKCGPIKTPVCEKHGPAKPSANLPLDISMYYKSALKLLGVKSPELVKGVRGTSNREHKPEHIAKGILRAIHHLHVNKDGTIRYDMSEIPITHFKPSEVGVDIETLKRLGYSHDFKGGPLTSPDQLVELFPQDIILPSFAEALDESADIVLKRVASFVDDELKKLYGLKQFYNINSKKDLIGQIVIGLAPHISAGMVGRIIGFSSTSGCLAHPLWHASLRRDCDGDEAGVILLMDALLNFSKSYLPDKRGSKTMDAPLVLTYILNPAEVDDMVHGMDTVFSYPLDFYEAALNFKMPSEVGIEQLKSRLGREEQYQGIGFTHPVSSINMGVRCSSYKTLPSMEDKLRGQMRLAALIRAVDSEDVATLVIEKHFIKDIKGNLRKFSQQQFRCVVCNEKYRRPPLSGRCVKCGGKIIFTISEGSVIKYLEPSLKLAEEYNVSDYLKQTLELTKMRVESVFGREKEKQEGLSTFFKK